MIGKRSMNSFIVESQKMISEERAIRVDPGILHCRGVLCGHPVVFPRPRNRVELLPARGFGSGRMPG
jgi:hypothetical protein